MRVVFQPAEESFDEKGRIQLRSDIQNESGATIGSCESGFCTTKEEAVHRLTLAIMAETADAEGLEIL